MYPIHLYFKKNWFLILLSIAHNCVLYFSNIFFISRLASPSGHFVSIFLSRSLNWCMVINAVSTFEVNLRLLLHPQATITWFEDGIKEAKWLLKSNLFNLNHPLPCLCQMDERVQKEAEERKNMEEELREQRGLIDALTAETMALREEAAALQVSTELHSSSGTSLLLRVQTVQINHFHSLSPPLRQGCSSGPQSWSRRWTRCCCW